MLEQIKARDEQVAIIEIGANPQYQDQLLRNISENILKNETNFDKCSTILKYTADYDTKIKKIGENKLGLASYIIKLS